MKTRGKRVFIVTLVMIATMLLPMSAQAEIIESQLTVPLWEILEIPENYISAVTARSNDEKIAYAQVVRKNLYDVVEIFGIKEGAATITYEALTEGEMFYKQHKIEVTVKAPTITRPLPEHVKMTTGETVNIPISQGMIIETVYSENADVAAVDNFTNDSLNIKSKKVGNSKLKVYATNGNRYLFEVDLTVESPTITAPSATNGYTITCNKQFADFNGVMVDSVLLPNEYYTAWEGSTNVKLNPSYIASLAQGTHNIELLFITGNVSTTLNIKGQNAQTPAPIQTPAPSQVPTTAPVTNSNNNDRGMVPVVVFGNPATVTPEQEQLQVIPTPAAIESVTVLEGAEEIEVID